MLELIWMLGELIMNYLSNPSAKVDKSIRQLACNYIVVNSDLIDFLPNACLWDAWIKDVDAHLKLATLAHPIVKLWCLGVWLFSLFKQHGDLDLLGDRIH
jgi:hypothetical protein